MKYEDMPVIKVKHGFEFADNCHILGQPKPCIQCGALTRAIDFYSEGHICSTECQKEFDDWCNEAFNRMQETVEI